MNIEIYDEIREPNRFGTVACFKQGVFYKGGGNKIEETKYEKEYAKIAQEKWKIYEEEYKPFVDQYIGDVRKLDSKGSRDFVTGAASTAASASFDKANDALSSNLQSTGVNPNSGKFKSATSGLRDAQGAASSESQTRAKNELKDQHILGLQNVAAIGRGDSTVAQAGMHDMASASADKAARSAYQQFNDRAMRNEAIGAGLGTAVALGSTGQKRAGANNNKVAMNYQFDPGQVPGQMTT